MKNNINNINNNNNNRNVLLNSSNSSVIYNSPQKNKQMINKSDYLLANKQTIYTTQRGTNIKNLSSINKNYGTPQYVDKNNNNNNQQQQQQQ